jgi:hypothetical protein
VECPIDKRKKFDSPAPFGHPLSSVSNKMQYFNNPDLPWVVQKFGGTSVGKFLDNIANQVVK